MNIPTTFQLDGQTWHVVQDKDLLANEGEYGSCHEVSNTIRLQAEGVVPRTRVETTFLHELLHAIFYELGQTTLTSDEKLIDSLSALLHQALNTHEN